MDSYTIAEKYQLPSKGLIYKNVPSTVTLRSMTTEEEMRRLSQSGTNYEKLCDIIDKCIIEDMPISSYDMCIGDYQGLLYKLRTVTYGSKCINPTICPHCGKINNNEVDIDTLKPYNFEGFKDEDFEFTLPKSGKSIILKYQTPRMLDNIDKDVTDFNNKNPENKLNMTMLFTLKNSIKYIDGNHLDPIKLELFLRKLVMADTNFLMKKIVELNNKVGVDINIVEKCSSCGKLYDATFRVSTEFFGPTEN